MKTRMRKFYIWLFTLAAIGFVYLMFNILSSREPIPVESGGEDIFAQIEIPDSNIIRGKIGKTAEIEKVFWVEYKHRNDEGVIDREFGFKELIRAEGSMWELDKPFFKFYRDNLDCIVTADTGNIVTENVGGAPNPRDGSLSGNVIIHIIPKADKSVEESFIYLENIFFEMETSEARTAGPIRFISRGIELKGRGLNFVFNGEDDRLEYLRIETLISLIAKVPSKKLEKAQTAQAADTKVEAAPVGTVVSIASAGDVIADSNETVITDVNDTGKLYRWVFNENVIIDGPEQLVFADRFSISNIELNGGDANGVAESTPETAEANSIAVAQAEEAGEIEKTIESEQEFVDIKITCDDGILFVPMDSDVKPNPIERTVTGRRGLTRYGDPNGRTFVEARQIDFDVPSRVVEMEGDCYGESLEVKGEVEQKYSVTTNRMRAELTGEGEDDISSVVSGVKHVEAYGGVVRLAVEKLENKQQIGFTKLLCMGFEYFPGREYFYAHGPGIIDVNNSRLTEEEMVELAIGSETQPERMSLKKPCFARIENFDSLEYFLTEYRIVADADNKLIHVGYMPVDGEGKDLVTVDVGRITAQLSETTEGRSELMSLSASKGVTYQETRANRDIQFNGSDLTYDKGQSLITVWGSESRPCHLNGLAVEGIKYNLTTGRLKETRVLGPGIIW